MSNLTTRKIVLGTLMVLVLAFSVQGIADAQSVSLSGDGTTTSASAGVPIRTTDTDASTVQRFFTIGVTGANNGENVTITPSNASITEVEVTRAPSASKRPLLTAMEISRCLMGDTHRYPRPIEIQIVPPMAFQQGPNYI